MTTKASEPRVTLPDLYFSSAYQEINSTKKTVDSYSSYPVLQYNQIHGQLTKSQISNLHARYYPNSITRYINCHDYIFCGMFSRDGNIFTNATKGTIIEMRDPQKNYKVNKSILARHVNWSIMDIDITRDNEYLVYSSWSPYAHICKINEDSTTEQIPLDFQPDNFSFSLFSIKFSHDGKQLFGGSNDCCLYLYDIEKRQRTLKIRAHKDDVNAVAFAEDSSTILFSASDDGLCKVWDTRQFDHERPVGILCGHAQGITHISSKSDGRYLITNSKDQSIKLWDIRVMTSGDQSVFHPGTNFDYRFQDGHPLRRKEKIPVDKSIMTYVGHKVKITLIRSRFSPAATTNERFIYSGCASGRIHIWDVLTGKKLNDGEIYNQHSDLVRDVYWHPYEPLIVSSSWDGNLGFWTRSTEEDARKVESAVTADDSSESEDTHYY